MWRRRGQGSHAWLSRNREGASSGRAATPPRQPAPRVAGIFTAERREEAVHEGIRLPGHLRRTLPWRFVSTRVIAHTTRRRFLPALHRTERSELLRTDRLTRCNICFHQHFSPRPNQAVKAPRPQTSPHTAAASDIHPALGQKQQRRRARERGKRKGRPAIHLHLHLHRRHR